MKVPGKVIDLRGRRYARLVVLAYAGRAARWQSRWKCKCDCGKVSVVHGGALNSGHTRSCGCLALEAHKKARLSHGGARRKSKVPEYQAWSKMIQRCTNRKDPKYPDYGGRGIRICARWRRSFSAFLADMGLKPSSKHSLDRIDNDGNYEPSNCRWATAMEQRHNQRPHRRRKVVS